MGIQFVIQEYLGHLKESKELDALIPTLLSAMGLVNLSSAQIGVKQYGVDLAAVGVDDDGVQKLFLFSVKWGDITRSSWTAGLQSLRNSLDEIKDTYLSTHIPPEYADIPKKVVVATNGEIKQEIQLTYAQYLSGWEKAASNVELVTWTGDVIAKHIEKFLLDEFVFPESGRSALRRALLTLDNPEVSVRHFDSFFKSFCDTSRLEGLSEKRRKDEVIKTLRACALGLAIYGRWAEGEGNLRPALWAAERSVIFAWTYLRGTSMVEDRECLVVYASVLVALLEVSSTYSLKLSPYYATQNAFASVYHDNIFVNDVVFEEIGHLALSGMIWWYLQGSENASLAEGQISWYLERLKAILESHSISNSPCYDNQAIDIGLAMMFLALTKNDQVAKGWLRSLIIRICIGKRVKGHFPIDSDAFADLIAVRVTGEMEGEKVATMSTMIPFLAQMCAVFDCEEDYKHILSDLVPLFKGASLQTWYPDNRFEDLLGEGRAHYESGLALAPYCLPDDFSTYKMNALRLPPGAANLQSFDFSRLNVSWLPLVFCRQYRCPVPTWYYEALSAKVDVTQIKP